MFALLVLSLLTEMLTPHYVIAWQDIINNSQTSCVQDAIINAWHAAQISLIV